MNGDYYMNEDKKKEKRNEIIGVCLDCFVKKGLTVTTTKDLCTAAYCKTSTTISSARNMRA